MDFEKPVVELEIRLEELKRSSSLENQEIAKEIEELEQKIERLKKKVYSNLAPFEKVQIARHPNRPRTFDYIETIFADFMEFHGDRLYYDDAAIVGGPARLDGRGVMVIGNQKGRNIKENMERNFGMPHPEGYRKALRLMDLAEKFSLPIVSFIDIQGAYPGVEAEERGQAAAIAENIMRMSSLSVPIVVIIIGEAGSGGALAIGVGDRIYMMENSYYSVITPEGCASILWHDETRAKEAAEVLKITSDWMVEFGIVDGVIPEPLGGAHRDHNFVASETKKTLIQAFSELDSLSPDQILQSRYERLRKIGRFAEE
ncbi:MAG: acetyl-CoA carboxylase carboxyltransferase subunit alpha [Actinomycetota bacterium]|nr:acetyl-CoA carboxylase carboxyltransferase subunit alpha [Actinomycetota bacterium]